MMIQTEPTTRPMNLVVDRDSPAAKKYRDWAAVIAPGLPTSPDHDLIYQGGKIVADLTFTNVYVGGQVAWQSSDIQSIDGALAASMSDRDLNNVMVQYFAGVSISSTFKPSTVLPGTPPAIVNQTDVETIVTTLYSDGHMKNLDLTSTVFNVILPHGTVLNDLTGRSHRNAPHSRPRRHQNNGLPKDQADSLHGLGGYHGSIHVAGASGTAVTVYYAVSVYSERRSDGTDNGILVFDAPWKNVAATLCHKLNEARTDADVEDAIKAGNNNSLIGWVSKQGEECGDYPVFEANPLTQVFQEVALTGSNATVPVQFMYSNAVHGPEGPVPNPH